MVTSPDQHKPGSPRATRIGALVTVAILLLYMVGNNHEGRTENIWLFAIAGLIVTSLLVDWALRRNGLKR